MNIFWPLLGGGPFLGGGGYILAGGGKWWVVVEIFWLVVGVGGCW